MNLGEIAHPKLSTIRTKSYMNIDEFYEKKILEKSILEASTETNTLPKRYKNYPWASSSIQIEHDFSKKSVLSPKFILMEKLRKKEAMRQHKASRNLYGGYSSRHLPPLKK